MTDKFDVEYAIRLWVEPGVHLEVGEWNEVPGYVHLHTPDEKAVNFFSKISLTLSPDMARQLAQSLNEMADRVSK